MAWIVSPRKQRKIGPLAAAARLKRIAMRPPNRSDPALKSSCNAYETLLTAAARAIASLCVSTSRASDGGVLIVSGSGDMT